MQRKLCKKAIPAFIIILLFVLAGIGGSFSSPAVARGKEIGPNEVQGKVLSIQTNALRRGTLEVKSDHTAKVYTFYLGNRTDYYPRRYPAVGETVRVRYLNDRGYLKASQVEIITSLP